MADQDGSDGANINGCSARACVRVCVTVGNAHPGGPLTSKRRVTLGLTGMGKALNEQRRADAAFDALCFEDHIGFRNGRRMPTKLKFAALRQAACVIDFD